MLPDAKFSVSPPRVPPGGSSVQPLMAAVLPSATTSGHSA